MKKIKCLIMFVPRIYSASKAFSQLALGVLFYANVWAAPGGVDSNLQLWVKADQGAHLDGSRRVTQLDDQSGSGRNLVEVDSNDIPDYKDGSFVAGNLFNFNPYMDFTNSGDGDVLGFHSGGNGVGANDNATLFVVARKANSATAWNTVMELGSEQPSMAVNSNNIFMQTPGGDANANISGNAFTVNQPHILAFTWTDTGANSGDSNIELMLDGKVTQDGANNYINNINTDSFYIGAGSGVFNNEPWVGEIAEAAVYNRRLAATGVTGDTLKVTSYLALKYGITLDSTVANYVDNTGVSVFSTNSNSTQWTDIAGLVKNSATNIDQRIAKSSNNSAVLTVSTDNEFLKNNSQHADTLANNDYLVWGHNNASATTKTTTEVDTNVYRFRIPREWKVQNRGVDHGVNLYFSGSDFADAPATTYFLLADDDGDFSNGGTVEKASSTHAIFTNVTLDAGTSFFTVAIKGPAPGGVAGDMQFWVNGGEEVTKDVSDNVLEWGDVSGNGRNLNDDLAPAQAPVFNAGASSAFNFQPYLEFTNDALSRSSGGLGIGANDNTTIFVVARKNNASTAWNTLIELDSEQPSMAVNSGNIFMQTPAADGNDNVAGGAVIVGQPQLYTYTWTDHTSDSDIELLLDGQVFADGGDFHVNTVGTGQLSVGGGKSSPFNEYWQGDIAEAIVYNSRLSAAGAGVVGDLQKATSYLAFKYGITLDQTVGDYINSAATSVYNIDATYKNGIAGLAKDSITALDQRIAKSVEAGSVLTVSTDTSFTGENKSHADTLSDGQYLVWGHNGASADTTSTADLDTNTYRVRMLREWKVQNTNAVAGVNFQFTGSGFPGATFYLLGSSNDDFTAGVTVLSTNTTGSFSNVVLPVGTSYITVALTGPGPGGVKQGVQIWAKADTLTQSDGSAVTGLADVSGNGRDLTGVDSGNTPLFQNDTNGAFNFNSHMTFTSDVLGKNSGGLGIGASDDATIYVVARNTNAAGWNSVLEFGNEQPAMAVNNGNIFLQAPNSDGNENIVGAAVSLNEPHILSYTWTDSTGNSNVELLLDGVVSGAGSGHNINDVGTGAFSLGAGNSSGSNEPWKGEIAETVVFNRRLSAASSNGSGVSGEALRITSYLAIKYGITLGTAVGNNYVDSAGVTIYTVAAPYNNGIAGLGRDNDSGLDQRIAKSSASGSVMVVSGDSAFTGRNSTHSSSITDKTFFMFGHNAGGTSLTQTSQLPSTYQARMARQWKVENKGIAQVNVKLTNLSAAPGSAYHLLLDSVDSDGDFSNAVSIASSTTGEFSNISLATGIHFLTVAVAKPSPGGVFTNSTLWLRADKDATDSGSTLTAWLDQSGSNNNAASYASDPNLLENQINFNSAIDFDGNDYVSLPFNMNPSQGDPSQYYIVYQQDAVNGGLIGNDNGGWDSLIRSDIIGANETSYTGHSGAANVLNTPKLISVELDDGGGNVSTAYVDGALQGSFTYSGANGGLTTTNIGSHGTAGFLDGRIAEVIAYRGSTQSVADRNRISSYLALKYGIALNAGVTAYVDASNTVVYPVDGTFDNDIAGIAKDKLTSIDQRISKSVNSGEVLTVSTDTNFNQKNTEHLDGLAEGQYIVWGNTGSSTAITRTTDMDASLYTRRMHREWKVVNSGDATTLSLSFDGISAVAGAQYYLLSDNNHDFSTGSTPLKVSPTGVFNSVVIPTGTSYLTVATVLPGPGGVNDTLQMWIRSDEGVTTDGGGGFRVEHMVDQSANNHDLVKQAGNDNPKWLDGSVNLFNFNPYMDFTNSNDGDLLLSDNGAGVSSTDSATVFVVARKEGTSGSWQTLAEFGDENPPMAVSSNNILMQTPGLDQNRTFTGGSVSANQPHVFMYTWTDTNANSGDSKLEMQLDGKIFEHTANTDTYINDIDTGATKFYIGAGNGQFSNEPWVGEMSEVLVFNSRLEAAGSNLTGSTGKNLQIQSYLALKYGITLDSAVSGYKNSADATVYAMTAPYVNNVVGLAKQADSNFDQRISKSVNSGSILTLSTDSNFSLGNAGHFGALDDGQYVIMGQNAGAATVSQTSELVTADFQQRMAREWKVQNTGVTAAVNIKVELPALVGATYHLLSDTDGDFSNAGLASSKSMSANGEFLNVTLPAGASYLTVAVIRGNPGGVSANLQLWARSDTGTTLFGNSRVDLWADQSGNGRDLDDVDTNDSPTWNDGSSNLFNFNPYMSTDGTSDGDVMGISSAGFGVGANDDVTIFAVARPTSNSASTILEFGDEEPFMGMGSGNIYLQTASADGNDNIFGGAVALNQPHIMAYTWTDHVSDSDIELVVDGKVTGDAGNFHVNFLNTSRFSIGAGNNTFGNNQWVGDFAETVIYNRRLAAAGSGGVTGDLRKVTSYLALKYGITLDTAAGDYVNNTGSSVYSIDGTFNNAIAGIAKDDKAGTDQRISKSVNTGTILTVSTNTNFTGINNTHADSLTDGQYLIWGHNDGTVTTGQTSELNTSAFQSRMAREWKVESTNSVGAINMQFTGLPVVGGAVYFLLVDSDSDFSNATARASSPNGTFISVVLNDGEYFTVAANTSSPGGVESNLQLWAKSNVGVSVEAGDRVTVLADQSGNGRNLIEVDSGDNPRWHNGATNIFNFNPYMQFNTGDGDVLGFNSGGNGVGADDDATVFVVVRKTTSSTAWNTVAEFGSEDPPMAISNNRIIMQTPDLDANATITGDIVSINEPHIMAFTWTDTGANSGDSNIEMVLDGKINTDIGNNYINDIAGASFYIGAGDGTYNNEPLTGEISETLIYNRRLAAAGSAGATGDLLKVTSYLALKYGVTLDSTAANYVNSSGASVYAITAPYNNAIAGIVKDDLSDFDQRISKSMASGVILTVSTDSNFTNINSSHADTLSNGQYLVWGSNAASTAMTSTADLPAAYQKRMLREWKVVNTGGVGPVNLQFSGLPALGGAQFHLLRDNDGDGDFADGATSVKQSDSGTFINVNLSSGNYTLAINISSPGGVSTDLRFWMKSDAGVTDNGTSLTAWADQSGNNQNATAFTSDPHMLTNQLNFNSAIDFDGNDSATVALNINPVQGDPLQFYAVYQQDAVGESGLMGNDNGGWDTLVTTAQISANGGAYTGHAVNANVANQAKLMVVDFDHGAVNGSTAYIDGALQGNFSYDNADGGTADVKIGSIGSALYLDGRIGEVITYRGSAQSSTDRNKIQSYMALRYGISLDNSVGNYLKSDGAAVFDIDGAVANSATATWQGIAGIGSDSTSALDQRISRSTNSGTVMTVSRDTDFTSENSAHTPSLADGQYLVWGHNNADATKWTTNDLMISTNHKHRLAREWKFENTGGSGIAVNVKVDGINAVTGVNYYLIFDADGDFSAGAITDLSTSSTGEFTGVTIPSGMSYVTVASNVVPQVKLGSAAATVSDGEGNTTLAVNILLNVPFTAVVNFTYFTTNGTATGGSDFTAIPAATPGSFAAGVTSQNINIAILGDALNEGIENFSFTIAGAATVTPKIFTISITDTRLPLVGNLGKSAGNPFTSIGMSRYVDTAGIYFFDLGSGNAFSTYVDDSGWVLSASALGSDDTGDYATTSALTLQSNMTLTPSLLSALTSADELRINDGLGSLDITTSTASVLTNLRANNTLVYSVATAGTWTGTGYQAPSSNCSSGANLQQKIYHGCGNVNAVHWIPSSNNEGVNSSSDTDLNLWVRAPAPSSEGARLWLQAYNGLVSVGASTAINGEPVSGWTSQVTGGASGVSPYSDKRPDTNTNGINFNASADFENAQQMDHSAQDILNSGGNDAATIFVVASRKKVTSGDDDLISFPGGAAGSGSTSTGDRPSIGFSSGTNRLQAQVTGNSTFQHTRNLALNTPYVFSLRMDNTSGANKLKLGVDGEEQSFTLGTAIASNSHLVIGASNNDLSEAFYGSISEVLIYNKVVDDVAMQQLQSYFALRYGITLTEATAPYLDSKTNYVFEVDDNTDGTPDWFNVAGIFKDHLVGQDVDQRISRSQNPSAKLTVSVDEDFADPNKEHVDRLEVGQYLVWGGNRLQTSSLSTSVASPFSHRIERYWKVQNTKVVTQVGLYVEDLAVLNSGQEYSLVVSSDQDFTTGLTVLGTSSNGAFTGIDFPIGVRFFTIAIGNISVEAKPTMWRAFTDAALTSLDQAFSLLVSPVQAADIWDPEVIVNTSRAKAQAHVLAYAIHEQGVSAPNYDTYVKAGLSGLSTSNIEALNLFVKASKTDFVHLISHLQFLLDRLQRFKKNQSPTVSDFFLIGVTGVNDANLAELVTLMSAQLGVDELATSPAYLQQLTCSVNALISVRNAAQSNDVTVIDMSVLNAVLGVVGLNPANISLYRSSIAALSKSQFATIAGLNEIISIVNKVMSVASGEVVSLSLLELSKLTITGLTDSNFSRAIEGIKNSLKNQIDTVVELQTVVSDAIKPVVIVDACSSEAQYTKQWFICKTPVFFTSQGVSGLSDANFSAFLDIFVPKFQAFEIGSVSDVQNIVDGLNGAPDLSGIVKAANTGDASGVTIDLLNSISGLININASSEKIYQSFIASRTAEQIDTLQELQDLIYFVNKLVVQAANNDNTAPVLTAAEFNYYGLNVELNSLEAVLLAISATADDGSEVVSFHDMKILVKSAVNRHKVLTEVLEDSVSGDSNANGIAVTLFQLKSLGDVYQLVSSLEGSYQSQLRTLVFKAFPTSLEIQLLVNKVNMQFIALDTDRDGLTDLYESMNHFDLNNTDVPVVDGSADGDQDSLTAAQEFILGTSDLNINSDSHKTAANELENTLQDAMEDFDGDGLPNKSEMTFGFDPLNANDPAIAGNANVDLDNNGLRDSIQVFLARIGVANADAESDYDSDGITDRDEALQGLNPLVKQTASSADSRGNTAVNQFGTGSINPMLLLMLWSLVFYRCRAKLEVRAE